VDEGCDMEASRVLDVDEEVLWLPRSVAVPCFQTCRKGLTLMSILDAVKVAVEYSLDET
jgi:hypothetical protein